MHYVMNRKFITEEASRTLPMITSFSELAIWIDDAVAALLRKTRRVSPLAVKQRFAEKYRECGFELDMVKSLIGRTRFVFLNQFAIRGLRVPQTHKIAAKTRMTIEGDLVNMLDVVRYLSSIGRSFVEAGATAWQRKKQDVCSIHSALLLQRPLAAVACKSTAHGDSSVERRSCTGYCVSISTGHPSIS